MADKKISQLPGATTPLTGAEELAIVQSGVTKKTTIEDVKGYKVYTALLTQSGTSAFLYVGIGQDYENIQKGFTYEIIANPDNDDFSNIGAPSNTVGTFFCSTQNLSNWIWGNNSILRYDEAAPVVTVLENTIGNIWFTYNGVGNYIINSNGLFTTNKSISFINTQLLLVNYGLISYQSENTFSLQTFQFVVDENIPIDGMLYNTPIEIRVYN